MFSSLYLALSSDVEPLIAAQVDDPQRFPPDPERPPPPNAPARTREGLIQAYRQSDLYQRMLREARASFDSIGPRLAAGKAAAAPAAVVATPQTPVTLPGHVVERFEMSGVYAAVQASKYPRTMAEQSWLLLKCALVLQRFLLTFSRMLLFISLVRSRRRGSVVYWRDIKRELMNVVSTIVIAVFCGRMLRAVVPRRRSEFPQGLIFLRLGDSITESGAKLGLIFFVVLHSAFGALGGIASLFFERFLFYRCDPVSSLSLLSVSFSMKQAL